MDGISHIVFWLKPGRIVVSSSTDVKGSAKQGQSNLYVPKRYDGEMNDCLPLLQIQFKYITIATSNGNGDAIHQLFNIPRQINSSLLHASQPLKVHSTPFRWH